MTSSLSSPHLGFPCISPSDVTGWVFLDHYYLFVDGDIVIRMIQRLTNIPISTDTSSIDDGSRDIHEDIVR